MNAKIKIITTEQGEDISRAVTNHLADMSLKAEPIISSVAKAGSQSGTAIEYVTRGIPGITEFLSVTGAAIANASVLKTIFEALRATVAQFSGSSIDFEIAPPNGPAFIIKGDHLRTKTVQECLELYREMSAKWSGTVS